MFDRTKRNGLLGRLMKKQGKMKGDFEATMIAAPIAMANYPKGAEIPILTPIINEAAIWRATEAYVDKGVGSMEDLYIVIWGMGLEDYLLNYDEQLGE